MDWTDVAQRVAALGAPVLGGALGGPAGALAGQIIGSALGAEDRPQAVMDVLDGMVPDQAGLELRAAELANRKALSELAIEAARDELAQVNETMRAELLHGNWFQKGWRPMFGYVTALAYGAILLAVAKVLWTGGDPALIGALGSVTVFLSVGLSVLGVTAFRRSTDKQTLAGIPQQPGIMSAVVQRISGGGVY